MVTINHKFTGEHIHKDMNRLCLSLTKGAVSPTSIICSSSLKEKVEWPMFMGISIVYLDYPKKVVFFINSKDDGADQGYLDE